MDATIFIYKTNIKSSAFSLFTLVCILMEGDSVFGFYVLLYYLDV